MYKTKEIQQSFQEKDILHFLSRLGSSEFKDSGNYFSFRTVCHNKNPEEAGFNLVYYKDTKLFRCFSECGQTFDVFGLARKYLVLHGEEPSFDDVYYFVLNYSPLEAKTGIGIETIKEFIPEAPQYRKQAIEVTLPEYSDKVLEAFSNHMPIEWKLDGISEEAYNKYNIKYSISRNTVVIPHYDVHGRLVGIRGRPLDRNVVAQYGKYRPLMVENVLYTHPLGFNVYGLNKTKEMISQTGVAIIAEGEKSCLQAETLLPKNVVVATCGSSINKWQILQIIKYTDVKEIIIAFDKEEEDEKKTYFNKLKKMGKKYRDYINISFIYDDWGYLDLKESPFDRDAETLNKLIERRIKIR